MRLRQGTRTDQHDLSHRLMLAAGFIAAAGFALVSLAANFRFGMSLASTPFDRAIYGTLSIAADLMKFALPLVVMVLWWKGMRIFAFSGAVFWIGAVAYSLSAAIGFAASTRGHAVASQANEIESRKAWEAKMTRIEESLGLLGMPRAAKVIETEINSLLRTPGAEGCRIINGPVTGEICPQVDRLRRELAASKEASRLEADLVADRQTLSGLPNVSSVADPQSSTLSGITGMNEDDVRSAIAVLIAFLVELGSALGFTLLSLASGNAGPKQQVMVSRPGEAPSPSIYVHPKANDTVKLQLMKTPDDLVTLWTLDRLDIVRSGMIQAEDAFRDFRNWCCNRRQKPLTPQMFGRRFTKIHADMGGRKVRRKGCAYYQGAALQTVPASPFGTPIAVVDG